MASMNCAGGGRQGRGSRDTRRTPILGILIEDDSGPAKGVLPADEERTTLARRVMAAPEVRTEVVERVRTAIRNGTYRVGTDAIARRMIEHMLGQR